MLNIQRMFAFIFIFILILERISAPFYMYNWTSYPVIHVIVGAASRSLWEKALVWFVSQILDIGSILAGVVYV
ncbi:hypothetical protein K491DRAFT_468720 [Lophiostoma macrostomum CBS 122681]|uniref:Uncharacterized protein n=1 Tax=Lophiostoma macrostomum CBS 122681 TaxID=1314788 RepID=A0A6A6T495_9PLEO|nr:hypothetical protein K491DRAFT_468720 [Lophiostoma macrostomum CBS 122681]